MDLTDLTVVIPVLNEVEAIPKVVRELREECGFKGNLLVVDGFSSDGTYEVLKDMTHSYSLQVIRQNGCGKGDALKTALPYIETPYFVVMDGDYTYSAYDLPKLYVLRHWFDHVIGIRTYAKGNMPILHRFGNMVINTLFNILLDASLSDVVSGIYLIRTDLAKQVNPLTSGFLIDLEFASKTLTKGRLGEVTVTYRKRIGKSKLNTFKQGIQIVLEIIRIWWTQKFAS